jgi:hypothetical protein
MTERVTSGLTWRGWRRVYGGASEAPSDERDGPQMGFIYEIPRQSTTQTLFSECFGQPLFRLFPIIPTTPYRNP